MKVLICALLCGIIFILFLATVFADREDNILEEWEDDFLSGRLGRPAAKEKQF